MKSQVIVNLQLPITNVTPFDHSLIQAPLLGIVLSIFLGGGVPLGL